MAVQKGQKRGSYKRSTQKRELQEDNLTPEDGMSYIEISNILVLSIAEVKKIERVALSKLKTPSNLNKDLHDYWNISLTPFITDQRSTKG